jgi:hypothetical protein
MSVAGCKVEGIHQITDMEQVEDREGRYRIQWTSDCGWRGSGMT